MARTRNLKIGLFQNEVLAQLPCEGRMLFAGLPLLADRAGRLEDRPLRIKATLFPFDDVKVDDLLDGLADRGFLERYTAGGVAVIQIVKFGEHQNPHPREPESTLPANPRWDEGYDRAVESRGVQLSSRAGSSGSSHPSHCSELPSEASEPPILIFACAGKPPTWALTKASLVAWAELYPGLDVPAECRKAFAWTEADKGHRKTASGMPRFLVNWFNRATNRGGVQRSHERPFTAQELADAKRVRANWRGGCEHEPRCPDYQACLSAIIRKWRAEAA